MSRKWLLFPFCLSILLALAPLSRAGLTLRVNESATRVWFEEEGTRVVLAVDNSLGRRVDAHVTLELIDSNDQVRGIAARDESINPGANAISLPIAIWLTSSISMPAKIPLVGKAATDTSDVLWYRMRYRVTPMTPSQFDAIAGVISLSEITPEIFSVHVAAPETANEGSAYRLRVRTVHPLTSRVVAGVDIAAEITFDGYDRDDIVLKQSARTGADGFATIDLQIPRGVEDDDGTVKVVARHGILTETAESELRIDRSTQILVSTDKPLYQPGQLLHTRVLMFDSSRHVLADQKGTLKVSDPESTAVFRADLNTNRFGVAVADWVIPENARLGDYIVEVDLDGDKYEDAHGGARVKISRYDLPNFSVNVKPDRPYYLPGQDAEVEVRADYLFGQPVKVGHVRVVRETEHSWNYREQKWDTEEGDTYEGDLDPDGRFIAHLKLGDEHEELKERDYSRYRDISYAAYLTDRTTNRTEQRRFDVRLTKDAIHLYVIAGNFRQTRNFPLEFYVSTSYADGTPATCDIAISRVWERDDSRPELALRTIRTNTYGVAKVVGLALPKDPDDDVSLMLRARDSKGAGGEHVETIDFDDAPVVRVETEKSLYRDGEPVHVEVLSSAPDIVLAVDVIREQRVLQSQFARLKDGRALLTFPYRPDLNGAITIAAYSPVPAGYRETAGSRTVLYPRDRDLRVKVALNQESFRPGEQANVNFLAQTAGGRSVESALGVVVFDKAVEERARTDREFGGGYGFYGAYCYLNNCSGDIAGVTRGDLDHIDLTKVSPEGLDLVAEMLLNDYRFVPHLFDSDEYETDPTRVFASLIQARVDPLKDLLDSDYERTKAYPTDLRALRRLSLAAGINFEDLRDPWETPYRTQFFPEYASDVFVLTSAGADKQFDTTDDFTALRTSRQYFRFAAEAIDRSVQRYHLRTGQFIRDESTLKDELRREGIDFDTLRDPWGQPYQLDFGVSQTNFLVSARSSGPDKQFTTKNSDDVSLSTSSIDYSTDLQAKIESALNAYFKATSLLPQNEADFIVAMDRAGINRDELRDPWGRPYYAMFKVSAIYGDRVTIFSYANYGEKPKEKIQVTPVTQQVSYIYLRSDGADGKEGTLDDFNVVTFSRQLAEQAGNEPNPQSPERTILLPGSTGAITGTITDPNGAVIAGAVVKAKNSRTTTEYATESSDDGVYLIKNLPAGTYEVSVGARGFNVTITTNVPVRSSSVTQVNMELQVGNVSSTVTVTGGGELLQTQQSQLSTSVGARGLFLLAPGVVGGKPQLSTPRLREYFPETLVWQPLLETDRAGRAQLKFKFADNITTWKMSVIASTEDGQIGAVEKEIKAFQPFFVEHDPPRVLTEGDEISLPVVVRNYLERAQTVNLEIKPESWFTLLGPASKRSEVAAGDARRETFDFRANASIKEGKQRITAIGGDANDAIERPVTVHPDGEEKSVTASDVIAKSGALTLDIPQTIIPNSSRAELKIYPNLMAHVAESVEAIMARPYGCGEQTISSTFPSLLLLRNYKKTGQDSPLRAKAERYLHDGYNRLLNYRDSSGGFTYWGRGEPDLALTAYALRFLTEASELIAVDDDITSQAQAWLIQQQRPDGSWVAQDYWNKAEDKRRTALLTAYVARVLAMTAASAKGDRTSTAGQESRKTVSPELKRAFDYLALRIEEIDEPYLIASYALAALDAKDDVRTQRAIEKLQALAHEENGASYWSLEINTPFYGWGLAGRVETTALAVQALSRGEGDVKTTLVSSGLLFLLRQKDRYGVWYSTQATINVLDALLALLARDADVARAANTPASAEIIVNGRSVKSVELPAPNKMVNPITVDLSQFVRVGTNDIEVRRALGGSPAQFQVVGTYYLPWRESVATQNANWRANGATGLRLLTKFDKTEAGIGAPINCHVEAERIGFSGYGMMLAEIGLPPGADVDRASLDEAMKGSDWSISQYDILPDRVVLYLWPRAGGTKFDFKFRPRYGLNAQTAPSIVYDYYNPEARAIVAPARFVVR